MTSPGRAAALALPAQALSPYIGYGDGVGTTLAAALKVYRFG